MAGWIRNSITLTGEYVDLIPLELYHFDELVEIAKDRRIWEFYAYDGANPARMREVLSGAMRERDNGSQYPFVVLHKKENRLIGSTRFMEMVPAHKKLEIGSTWLHPDYWATAINLECKLLLLTFCFEQLGAVRVQFKTDENNLRSRKAIEKIGGQFEGILRNDMIRDNQTLRNSAYYSILSSEWNDTRAMLSSIYNEKKNGMEKISEP